MVIQLKKNKPALKDKEKVILAYIDKHAGGCTANEISEATGISYITVQKYLARLVKLGILEVEDGKKQKDDPLSRVYRPREI